MFKICVGPGKGMFISRLSLNISLFLFRERFSKII